MQPAEPLGGRADQVPLDREGALRFDQLPTDRPQERLGHGRGPQGAEAFQMANGLTEQRVVGEPADERAVVVVAGQHEAELRESGLGLGP